MGIVLHVGEFGLRSVVTAEAGAVGAVRRPLLWRYLTMRMAFALAATLIAVLLTYIAWPAHTALMAMLLLVPFAIASHLDWVALVRDRPLQAGLCLLVKPAMFSLILWQVPGFDTPLGVATALAIAWWTSALVTWPQWRQVEGTGAVPKSAGAMAKLGLPLMANTLVNQLQLSLDLMLVGWVAGAALAGHYYLAAAVTAAGLVFANATGQIATARMAKFRNDPGEFRNELHRQIISTLFIALVISLGLIFVGAPLVPWVFGPEHSPSAGLLVFFVPWFMSASVSTHLQGALTANLQQAQINRGNRALGMALVPAMALALLTGWPPAFALARAVGECARLIVLWRATFERPNEPTSTTVLGSI